MRSGEPYKGAPHHQPGPPAVSVSRRSSSRGHSSKPHSTNVSPCRGCLYGYTDFHALSTRQRGLLEALGARVRSPRGPRCLLACAKPCPEFRTAGAAATSFAGPNPDSHRDRARFAFAGGNLAGRGTSGQKRRGRPEIAGLSPRPGSGVGRRKGAPRAEL